MKNVHYAVINFYYALVSTGGYLVWGFYEIIIDTSYQEFWPKYLSFKNWSFLLTASISHVFALVFWTMAFQHGKTGKVSIIAYSQIVYSMLVDLLVFRLEFSFIQAAGMIVVFITSLSVALIKM